MKTFIAVSNYDRRLYARSSIALAATLGLGVLIGIFIVLNYSLPFHPISPLLAVTGLVGDTLLMAVPFIFLRYAVDLGRSASPLKNRLIVHSLPVDRCELALAKLFHGFIWVFLVPLVCILGVIGAFKFGGVDWSHVAPFISLLERPGCWLGLPLIVLASLTWVMLLSALVPGRWLVIGAPLLIIGEALARNITTGQSLVTYVMAIKDHPRTTLSVGIDLSLVALLTLLLAGIFVRYHVRRNRTWSLTCALLVLAGIEGVRALACWQTTLPN